MNVKYTAIAVFIIIIGALGWFMTHSVSAPTSTPQNTPQSMRDAKSLKTSTLDTEDKASSTIDSIKTAMGLNKKMKCTYGDATGAGVATTLFIEGSKMKTMTSVNNETMYSVFDGDTHYTWTEGSKKQGFKMDKACLDTMKTMAEKMPQSKSMAPTADAPDIDAIDALKNVRCESAESEDFSIPKDIEFADQCAAMQDSMKMLEQMKNSGVMSGRESGAMNIPQPK